MSILGAVKKLFLPKSAPVAPEGISRRKFFSFFGTWIVMAAAPNLLLPKTPLDKIKFYLTPEYVALMREAFETEFKGNYPILRERIFFQMLVNPDSKLLPAVPEAADGAALFATTSDGPNLLRGGWTE